jgi:hypothetical protein
MLIVSQFQRLNDSSIMALIFQRLLHSVASYLVIHRREMSCAAMISTENAFTSNQTVLKHSWFSQAIDLRLLGGG